MFNTVFIVSFSLGQEGFGGCVGGAHALVFKYSTCRLIVGAFCQWTLLRPNMCGSNVLISFLLSFSEGNAAPKVAQNVMVFL